jgi:hypothetical protein
VAAAGMAREALQDGRAEALLQSLQQHAAEPAA